MSEPHKESARSVQALSAWDGEALARALVASSGKALVLKGASPEQLSVALPQVREALRARGHLTLAMDPAGVFAEARTLSQVIELYLSEVSRHGGVDEPIQDLVAWLHTSPGWEGPRQAIEREVRQADALGRLWSLLSAVLPATLVVFHPERCATQVRRQLGALLRYHFSDPIESLAPEYEASSRIAGCVLAVAPQDALPEFLTQGVAVELLDASAPLEQRLREFLSRDDVVRRLMAGARGDVGRLERIVEDLGDHVQHLMVHRVDALAPEARALLELLALADEPMEMGWLGGALTRVHGPAPYPALLRTLHQDGWLARGVQMGAVRLTLSDVALGEALAARLEPARRVALHEALMEAALAQPQPQFEAFVARHALGAGRREQACRYGLEAGRRLFVEGALQEAAEVLEAILDGSLGCDVDAAQARAMLMEIHGRLGRWARALSHGEALMEGVVGVRGRVVLACRLAALLTRINAHDEVIARMDAALAELEGVEGAQLLRAQVLLEQAEALYELGRQAESEVRTREALDALVTSDVSDHPHAAELTRAQVQGRNLLGKTLIFQSRFDEAQACFEANVEAAKRWGWAEEIARAEANQGVVAMQRGESDRALALFSQMAEAARLSVGVSYAVCLGNMGFIHHQRMAYHEALRLYLEALRAAHQSAEQSAYSIIAYNLAILYRDMGALERAAQIMAHLTALEEQRRHPFVQRWAAVLEMTLSALREDHEGLIAQLDTIQWEDEEPVRLHGGDTRPLRLAQAHLARGDAERARELLTRFGRDEADAPPTVRALTWTVRAQLSLHDEAHAQALTQAREASRRWRAEGSLSAVVEAEVLSARALVALERDEEAAQGLSALGRELHERAQALPGELRDELLALPTYGALRALAGELEVALPAGLTPRRTLPEGSARALVAPVRDEAWMRWRARYGSMVGESPKLHQIFRVLDRVAASPTSLLILGESGTGKELIAQSVHQLSGRSQGAFIKVNCAAFVETLLMSELFGHEKGAFTGAVQQKIGRFELADGGTLFLDEIADISMQTQVALLRVLQERELERVGGTQTIKVDVRLICATNKNLEALVQRGEFRLDLYYRLKGMVIEVPALRERREDVPRLIDAFAKQSAEQTGEPVRRFAPDVLRYLMSYSWPGNVRELQNFVSSILLFVEGDRVTMEHLEEFGEFFSGGDFTHEVPTLEPAWLVATPKLTSLEPLASSAASAASDDPIELEDALVRQIVAQGLSLTDVKKRLEVESIRRALIAAEGNVTQAAKTLQMKRPRLSQIISATDELSDLKSNLTG